jgi:hypothetical protein
VTAASDVLPVAPAPAVEATATAPVSQPEALAVVQLGPVLEPPLAGATVVASDADDPETAVVAPEPALPAIAIADTKLSEATVVVAEPSAWADTVGPEAAAAGEPDPTPIGATAASESSEAPQPALPIVQVTPAVGLSSAPEAVVAPAQTTERPLAPSSGREQEPLARAPLHAVLTPGVAGGDTAPRPPSVLDVPASARAADEVRDRRTPDVVSSAQPVTHASDAPARIVQNPDTDGSNMGLGAEMLLAVLAVMLRGGAGATRRRSRSEEPSLAPARSGRCPVGRHRRPRVLHGCARPSGHVWLRRRTAPARAPGLLRPLPRPRRTERSAVRA